MLLTSKGILANVGRTPLVRLDGLRRATGIEGEIFGKLEYCNPTGSICDRTALYLIVDAEKQGLLSKNSLVVDASMGNFGVSLSFVCRLRGYRCTIVLPPGANRYMVRMIQKNGANIVYPTNGQGMQAAIDRATEIWENTNDAFMPRQFDSDAAVEAHRRSTGPELLDDMNSEIGALVGCVGTGASLSGAGEHIKAWVPECDVIAVEPAESPVLAGKLPAAHGIYGVSPEFVPGNYNQYIVDTIVPVSSTNALKAARLASSTDGVLCGIAGGAALFAAIDYALKPENAKKRTVVLFGDSQDRYYDTPLFDSF